MLNSYQTQNGLEIVFRLQFLWSFLVIFFLCNTTKWPNFINRLYLLPKSFSEMYFLFYALVFDDVMNFENVEF